MVSAFEDHVHFLLGGRYDFASALSSVGQSNPPIFNNALDRANVLGVSTKDRFFSPRVGLVVQPWPWFSIYGNYTQSFGVNNGVTRSNTPLGSQQAIQWEGGMKAEFFDKRLLATVAYFDIKKYNLAQYADRAGNLKRLRGRSSRRPESGRRARRNRRRQRQLERDRSTRIICSIRITIAERRFSPAVTPARPARRATSWDRRALNFDRASGADRHSKAPAGRPAGAFKRRASLHRLHRFGLGARPLRDQPVERGDIGARRRDERVGIGAAAGH